MEQQQGDRLLSASILRRQRGWTDDLLVTLLGRPDALSPNPHGWRAPKRWYREDRVLDAERSAAFARRMTRLDERTAWRRDLPTRVFAPEEIDHLEWLDDPARIALFHAPRRPRLRRPKPAPTPVAEQRAPLYPLGRYTVLRLF